MPVDPSIYSQQQPQRFNTPFDVLGQLGQLQQQRQAIQSNQALEQERRAKLAADQQKQAEADRFNQIIGNPNFTREAMLATIKAQAPEHYLSAMKSFEDLDKSAAEYEKTKAEAKDYAARAQKAQQDVIGTVANTIASHGYQPAAFEVGLKELETRFPEFAPTAQNYRQLALQNGPQWIKEHVDGLRSMSDRSTEAKISGEQAASELAQRVTAGTSPQGITAQQQAQNALGAQTAAAATRNAATNAARETREGSSSESAPSLTPDAMDLVARQFAMTGGNLPPMGMGKAGAKVRTDIINRSAEIYKGLDLASQKAAFDSSRKSLDAMQKQRDAVGSFEETALKNLDQFLGTAQKVVDTGSPLINRPLRAIGSELMGSPEMSAYNAARRTVIPEFAKILSNPTLSGQLSDSARKEVEELVKGDATLKQIVAVAKVLKQDTENRRTSLDDAIKAIQTRIATPPGTTPQAASTPQTTNTTPVEKWEFVNGKLVKVSNATPR